MTNDHSIAKRGWIIALLLLGTFFALGLAAFLRHKTNSNMYNFLGWDMFLAWIPLAGSFLIELVHRMPGGGPGGCCSSQRAFGGLCFFRIPPIW
ncbi:hypothetical protein [Paenibacillus sp. MBLB4367]|uniref:hypothetical protein n=1 Tax=Paenibacillus sp. MBLB4367 TaxID=3384767 RepID=UPI0039083FE1